MLKKKKHLETIHIAVEIFLLIVEEKLKTQLIKITLKLGRTSLSNRPICSREQISSECQKQFCTYFDTCFKTSTSAWALFR